MIKFIKNIRGVKMLSRRIIFPLFLISLTLIFGLSMVSATSSNIYVNTTGSDITGIGTINHPYHTIKKGISNLNNKGTLYIANGKYSGVGNTKITINKSMNIIGRSQTNTMINGQHINWIFHINPGCVVSIKNLKITYGNTTQRGGAIYNNGSTLTVNGSTFNGNTAMQDGGAIWNDAGKLTVIDSIFTGNIAHPLDGGGGAIGFTSCILKVSDSTFKNNIALIGGAICGGGVLTVTGSTFTYNIADTKNYGSGGAICNGGSLTNIIGSTFNKNTALSGGAINCYNNLTVISSTFKGNTAMQFGGSILHQGGTLYVIGSRFTNNTAEDGGGAICTGSSALSTVKDSTFTDNMAKSQCGGAIYDFGGTLNVKGSTFINNTAPNGGAICSYGTLTNVMDSTFKDNNASNGGAIYNAHIGKINVKSSTFTNNTAKQYGGAIYNQNYNKYGTVYAVFDRFYKNTASNGGSAIYTNGTSFTADNNWWGSNNPDFVSLTGGTVTPTKWLVLRIYASTPTSSPGPVLTADLTWNNLDQQTTGGYLANGTTVNFSIISGPGSVNPTNSTTQNGTAKSTYTTTQVGTPATVKVTVDDETLTHDITVN